MQEENLEFKNIFESITDPESAQMMKSLSDKLIKSREELEAMHNKLEAQDDHCKTLCAHIDELTSENESLDDKLQEQLCLVGSLLEAIEKLLAEREAMTKQEPVGYKVNDTKNKSEWITTIQNPEKYKLDYPDFVLTPVYAHPLPAQQIPEGLKDWFVRLTNCLSCYDDGEYFGKCCPQDMLDELESMLSASQPRGDV